jgi:hypothetical protein
LQLAAGRGRGGIAIVDEADMMADKAFVLDRHAFANESVRTDFASRPDDGIFLDFDERADLGFIADRANIQIDENANPCIPPNPDIRRDAPCLFWIESHCETRFPDSFPADFFADERGPLLSKSSGIRSVPDREARNSDRLPIAILILATTIIKLAPAKAHTAADRVVRRILQLAGVAADDGRLGAAREPMLRRDREDHGDRATGKSIDST